MRVNSGVLLVALFFLAGALSACAEKNPQPMAQEYPVPHQYIFAVPYESAWQGTVRAISEEERISTLERESGLIVTEYRTINQLVQNLISTAIFGKVYKNGYTVNLSEVASGQTRITIRSKLLLEQLTIYTSELQDERLNAYMRQELFRKICLNLQENTGQCIPLFPDYHGVSVSCPAPSSTSVAGADGQSAPPPRVGVKAKAAPVKQIQQALINAGYAPGPVDGRMGQRTRAAIRSFQQDKGIVETGSIDWSTLAALGF